MYLNFHWLNTNGAAGLAKRTMSQVNKLRLSSVALEVKRKVWNSREKAEMSAAEVKGADNITRRQYMEDEGPQARLRRSSKSRQKKETKAPKREFREERGEPGVTVSLTQMVEFQGESSQQVPMPHKMKEGML